jgi:hypothetical protein
MKLGSFWLSLLNVVLPGLVTVGVIPLAWLTAVIMPTIAVIGGVVGLQIVANRSVNPKE